MKSAGEVSLAERAYQMLKRDILLCVFKPMGRLNIEQLKSRYNMGATPLREALNRLLHTGFVEREALKGFRVSALSIADLKDVYEQRILLEKRALVGCLDNADVEWESTVVAAMHRLRAMFRKVCSLPVDEVCGMQAMQRYNEYHDAIYSATPSRWLRRVIATLCDHADRYRCLPLVVGYPRSLINDNTLQLIEDFTAAILNRDILRVIESHELKTKGIRDLVLENWGEYASEFVAKPEAIT